MLPIAPLGCAQGCGPAFYARDWRVSRHPIEPPCRPRAAVWGEREVHGAGLRQFQYSLGTTYMTKSPADRQKAYQVRCLRVVQKVLRRDKKDRNLSLRKAAEEGSIALSTLRSVLHSERITDFSKHPKRGLQYGTLLQLRSMPWISRRSTFVLDALLARRANPV